MTRQDLIEHAEMIISNAPELEKCRAILYYAYELGYRAPLPLVVECLYWYYRYIDLRVTRDDIEFHLWGEDELFILDEMLFESYTQNK